MYDTQGPFPDYTHFVAVKVIRACRDMDAVRREANLLHYVNSTFASPDTCFVATILAEFNHQASDGNTHLCLVFKLLGPELLKLVEERKEATKKGLPLNLLTALSIFKCVLRGVAGLHAHEIVHTDLKPENILLAVPERGVIQEITAFCRDQRLKPPFIAGTRQPAMLSPSKRPHPQQQSSNSSTAAAATTTTPLRPSAAVSRHTPQRTASPQHFALRSPAPTPVNCVQLGDRRANVGIGRPSIAHATPPPLPAGAGLAGSRAATTPVRQPIVASPRVRVTPGTPQYVADQGSGTQVLLGDFGLAMVLQRNHTLGPPPGIEVYDRQPIVQNNKIGAVLQTREYRAPEIILGQDFNLTIDIFSVACIMVELITGDYLWDPKNTLLDGVAHTEENIDMEHLQHMVAVLGSADLPRLYDRRAARKERFFDAQGNLRAHRLRAPNSRPLDGILRPHVPCDRLRAPLVALLRRMLAFHPLDRPTAKDCLHELEAIIALAEAA